LIGIEEPENHLHPRLLPELAEECRSASARTQIMATTHSPFFLNGLKPEEAWILYRNQKGFTEVKRVSDLIAVQKFMQHGAQLGHLWMEGHFGIGDPLTRSGEPIKQQLKKRG
jgi:predicted ATPase